MRPIPVKAPAMSGSGDDLLMIQYNDTLRAALPVLIILFES